jgi:hypothetical protein
MVTTICACHSPEHQLLTEYDEEYEEVNIQVHLVTYRGFFKRLQRAFMYLFGYKSRYGDWDCIILNKENSLPLIQELNKLHENKKID